MNVNEGLGVTTIYGKGKEGKRKFTQKRPAVLFSSDLKDKPARGSKYCQDKRYQFFSEFRTVGLKSNQIYKFLMEV